MILTEILKTLPASDPEQRQLISGVFWEGYETLLKTVGDESGYRITYLDGLLELMSPSRRHESAKKMISSLLEDYLKAKAIPFFPLGSTTFRKAKLKGGTEPDESYCFGVEKEVPDLVIEVIVTSGGIDKLEVYRRLGVSEVWFLQNGQLAIYCLEEGQYNQSKLSRVLPNLEINLLQQYVNYSDPLSASLEFRKQI
jgi:Uma2 family endonuclease